MSIEPLPPSGDDERLKIWLQERREEYQVGYPEALEILLRRIWKSFASDTTTAELERLEDMLRTDLVPIRASLTLEQRIELGKEVKIIKDEPMSESNIRLTAEHPVRSSELDALLMAVVEYPEGWMATPSAQFGGRRPIDLVGTEEEVKIFDILRAVDQGLF
jgi:hypothetical protein